MRTHVFAAALAAALLAAVVAVAAPPPEVGAQANPYARSAAVESGNFFNPDGVLYGYLADFTDQGGGTAASYAQVTYHQSQIGQNVSIVHVFSGGWNNNFNATFANRLATLAPSAAAGKVPMYSLGNPNATHMNLLLNDDPGEIAKVQAWAATYRDSGIGPMFARLSHEPDRPDRDWAGNPSLFVDWWRKFVEVVETDTAEYTAPDSLIWLFSPTAWGFWHDNNNGIVDPLVSRAAALYPGDDYVDWIGSSGYDYPCAYDNFNPHPKVHEDVLEPALSWASQVAPTKPYMVAEWGSENTVGNNALQTRADWFATTDDMLRSDKPGFDQIGAMVYFDRHHNEAVDGNGNPAGCNWLLHEPAPAFPNPNSAYNQGANAGVSVTNASDFAGYHALVNTPGLFVPLGSYEPDPDPPGPDASCSVTAIQNFVEVSWEGLEGENVNIRRDGVWIYDNGGDDAITSYDDTTVAAGTSPNYVARYWSGGASTDLDCGSAALPDCSATLVGDAPTVSWNDLNQSPQLRVNDVWRTTITSLESGSYADTQTVEGGTYSYVIRMHHEGNAFDLSCGTVDVPAGPACSATADSGTVTVDWSDIGPASSLNLLRNGSWNQTIGNVNATSAIDVTAAPGQTSSYTLRIRHQGNVTDLDCGSVTLDTCVARAVAGGIEVAWAPQAGSLNLRRNGSWLATVPTGSVTYDDTGVTSGQSYDYVLKVRNGGTVTLDCGSATA